MAGAHASTPQAALTPWGRFCSHRLAPCPWALRPSQLRGARPRLAHLPPGARRPLPISVRPPANSAFARPVRRTAGCRVEGSVCSKDSLDCCWSVALGRCGVAGDRQIWALKVGGRTGRMAIGVALDTDEVSGAGWCSKGLRGFGLPTGAGV